MSLDDLLNKYRRTEREERRLFRRVERPGRRSLQEIRRELEDIRRDLNGLRTQLERQVLAERQIVLSEIEQKLRTAPPVVARKLSKERVRLQGELATLSASKEVNKLLS